jgi:hypothetical protein
MANKSIDKRRKIRAAEAQRDKLLESQEKNKISLAQVRAQLKTLRRV